MKILIKESIISIKKSFKRFLSIFLITLLGVGFFAGIRSTSPDMKATINKYYKETNFMDISLISTAGITNTEINDLIGKGYNIEGEYSFDAIVKTEQEEVVKIHSYNKDNKINKLILISGKLPIYDNECVIEKTTNTADYKIGDKILIEDEKLKEKELTIVGYIKSPIYASIGRGTTKLSAGRINFFIYVPETNFNYSVYTSAFIKLNNNYDVFSDEYKELIKDKKKDLVNITNEYSELNQNEIIGKPIWHILDRSTNLAFFQYEQDAERIANIGKVFPLIFFVVAVLICLTSMTRMVEEERGQLGTLKALGYTDIQIIFKYICYALLATILGSICGIAIGIRILPKVIFTMYSMMYDIGDIVLDFNLKYPLVGTVIAIFCTTFATLLAAIKELKSSPAILMRVKAPRLGKRVFLEKIGFIWKRLNFSRKVTIRNLFRYKKRFLMTIIGIAGCTALILAGFGIKDCITGIVPGQYEDVYNYEIELFFKDKLSDDIKELETERIKQINGVTDILRIEKKSVKIINKNTNQQIQLVIPLDEVDGFINFKKRTNKKGYVLDDKLIVSEKIAKLLNIKKADVLKLEADDEYAVEVGNITENYIYHYIYMNKDLYKGTSYNTLLVKTNKMTEEEEKILANEIKKNNTISSIEFTSSLRDSFDSIMDNFSFVAVILIISAGLLAFVVLYNLAYVNISERKRELATIKVLGFYDKEVYNYINRETTILTFIGIILGLAIGKILTIYIIRTCELDAIMFNTVIKTSSYIYSVLITIVFTLLVNIFVYSTLKKIDMIESLKSIE